MDIDAIIKKGKESYEFARNPFLGGEKAPSEIHPLYWEACQALVQLQAENKRLKDLTKWILENLDYISTTLCGAKELVERTEQALQEKPK